MTASLGQPGARIVSTRASCFMLGDASGTGFFAWEGSRL